VIRLPSGEPPSDAWRRRAEAATQKLMAAGSLSGRRFNKSIIRGARAALFSMTHGKCAYCEIKLTRQHGDVDHYRPIGCVAEDPTHPGYYWLAYDWENLLLSCQFCNQAHRAAGGAVGGKRDHFPLSPESKRAMSPADSLDDEQPLLLNPRCDNPAEHLRYTEIGSVMPLDDSPRGRASCDFYDLNECQIVERRTERLQQILRVALRLWLADDEDCLADAVRELAEMTSDEAEFAGMARDVLMRPADFALPFDGPLRVHGSSAFGNGD